MNRLFGRVKKKAPEPEADDSPKPTTEDISQKMDTRVTDLQAKVNKCNEELKSYQEKMKQPGGQAYKKQALMALKRRKMYEEQLLSATDQQFNLDQITFAMDSAKVNVETVAAMKAGAESMKKQVAEFDIDELEEMQDDLAELYDEMNEVTQTLSYAVGNDIDENELLAELEELENSCVDLNPDESYLLPSPPIHNPEAGEAGKTAIPSYLQ